MGQILGVRDDITEDDKREDEGEKKNGEYPSDAWRYTPSAGHLAVMLVSDAICLFTACLLVYARDGFPKPVKSHRHS